MLYRAISALVSERGACVQRLLGAGEGAPVLYDDGTQRYGRVHGEAISHQVDLVVELEHVENVVLREHDDTRRLAVLIKVDVRF